MALFEVSPTMLPGEAGLVALANLFEKLVENQSPEQVKILTDRFLELSEPYHKVNVAIAEHVAEFLSKVLHINTKPL